MKSELTYFFSPCILHYTNIGFKSVREKVLSHLTECIGRMVLESQLPHKIVNLLFVFTIEKVRHPSCLIRVVGHTQRCSLSPHGRT
jgi:hypothetical protein